jgi:hypothetical protein
MKKNLKFFNVFLKTYEKHLRILFLKKQQKIVVIKIT